MDLVKQVLEDIIRIASPCKVILYSKKEYIGSGTLKSMDFCVVVSDDPQTIRKQLIMQIDYDIPINFKVYHKEDWGRLMTDTDSHAYLIAGKGLVLYEC